MQYYIILDQGLFFHESAVLNIISYTSCVESFDGSRSGLHCRSQIVRNYTRSLRVFDVHNCSGRGENEHGGDTTRLLLLYDNIQLVGGGGSYAVVGPKTCRFDRPTTVVTTVHASRGSHARTGPSQRPTGGIGFLDRSETGFSDLFRQNQRLRRRI